jgi:exodeoxyribonuclease VII small subunit
MTTAATTPLTFEDGYHRLQQIADRLNQEDVPVSEMCDLFAEGKGLEQALTDYLDTQKARVEAIKNGEGVQAFTIAGQSGAPEPSQGQPASGPVGLKDTTVDSSDFVPASTVDARVADDEIPF